MVQRKGLVFMVALFCVGAPAEEVNLSQLDPEQRAAAETRSQDAAWKAATKQVGLIKVGDEKNPGAVRNYCLNREGNVLACFAPVSGEGEIREYSPEGKLLKTIVLDFKPTAICVVDGGIMVAGDGRVQKIDGSGKKVASAASPVASLPVEMTKETEEMVREMATQNNQSFEEELARMKTTLEKRRSEVTGLAATEQDVFMAVPSPVDFGYRIYRLNHALEEPKLVVQKLRGCCGQMDVQAHEGKMWIPHNARHAIEKIDRDGKQLAKFGKAGKVRPADFGGCCEPKSIRVLPNGDILAAESGPPTCIKRFSPTGKFKEVIALVEDVKGDCVRVTVEMSPDGSKYYMLDTTRDAIRVFAANP